MHKELFDAIDRYVAAVVSRKEMTANWDRLEKTLGQHYIEREPGLVVLTESGVRRLRDNLRRLGLRLPADWEGDHALLNDSIALLDVKELAPERVDRERVPALASCELAYAEEP